MSSDDPDRLAARYVRMIEAELGLRPTAGDVCADASTDGLPELGVLLLKPGVVAELGAFGDIKERLRAVGVEVARARVVGAGEVRAPATVAAHYRTHWARASASWLTPIEVAHFRDLYGSDPVLPVRGAWVHLAASGVDPASFADWVDEVAERHGVKNGDPRCTNTLSDVCDVQLVPSPELGGPVYALNPQCVSMSRHWARTTEPLVAFLLRGPADRQTNWSDVHEHVLGVGPSTAWPGGSLRGAMRDGRLGIRHVDGAPASTARTGIHLSNGPVEAMCEAELWTGLPLGQSALGEALAARGVEPRIVAERPFVHEHGESVALVERTAGMTIDAAVRLIVGAADRLRDGPPPT